MDPAEVAVTLGILIFMAVVGFVLILMVAAVGCICYFGINTASKISRNLDHRLDD